MTTTPPNKNALIPAANRDVSDEAIDGLNNYGKTGAPAWFGDLLKFNGKTGLWTYGKDSLPIEDGRVLAAIVPEALAGHVLFEDGELVDQDWQPAFQFNPREHRTTFGYTDQSLWSKDEKGKPVDPVKEAVMLPMVDPATREEFTFSSFSIGGVRAAKRLATTYVKQIKAAPETTKGCLPVVALGSDSYPHPDKKRGTIYNPIFEGREWMRASDLLLPPEPGENGEPPDYDTPDPQIPLAEPPAKPAMPAPAPAKQRRRRG
jgi:hypothetical protein